MRRLLLPVLPIVLVALAAGCGGGGEGSPSEAPPEHARTGARGEGAAAVERAVRTAVRRNARLSDYVLLHNRLPSWARRSTRGPALAALRRSASERRGRDLRLRGEVERFDILGIRLDPSYLRATARVRRQGQVRPYRRGRPLGRSIRLDERARLELRRVGERTSFVVWRVSPRR